MRNHISSTIQQLTILVHVSMTYIYQPVGVSASWIRCDVQARARICDPDVCRRCCSVAGLGWANHLIYTSKYQITLEI